MVYPNPQIYHHLKAIFVHVPKTAGTSVERSLRHSPDQVVGGHTTALGYRRKFPEEFAHYFKFAIIRNPVDRFLSAYRYLRARPPHEALSNAEIHEVGSFEPWMRRVVEDPGRLDRIVHLRPQHEFVCDREGRVLVDRIYRYESLDVAWTEISERLGLIARPLPRLNPSKIPTRLRCRTKHCPHGSRPTTSGTSRSATIPWRFPLNEINQVKGIPIKSLDTLPKRFAEKIESKFSRARREGGSAAGCVTEEQRNHGRFWPILNPISERSEQSQTPKTSLFSAEIFGKGSIRAIDLENHVRTALSKRYRSGIQACCHRRKRPVTSRLGARRPDRRI